MLSIAQKIGPENENIPQRWVCKPININTLLITAADRNGSESWVLFTFL
jgi:hypothetical protein